MSKPDGPLVAEVIPQPPRRSIVSVEDEGGKVQKIRGRLLRAIELMIWGEPETGKPVDWSDAAKAVGMKTRSMRLALAKPHVRAFVVSEKKICREAVGAANVMVAKEIRDQNENQMAKIRALQWLEGLPADQPARGFGTVPGVVVVISNSPSAAPVDNTIIEINPVSDRADEFSADA